MGGASRASVRGGLLVGTAPPLSTRMGPLERRSSSALLSSLATCVQPPLGWGSVASAFRPCVRRPTCEEVHSRSTAGTTAGLSWSTAGTCTRAHTGPVGRPVEERLSRHVRSPLVVCARGGHWGVGCCALVCVCSCVERRGRCVLRAMCRGRSSCLVRLFRVARVPVCGWCPVPVSVQRRAVPGM